MNQAYMTKFTTSDIEAFLPAMKIGLLASVTDAGLPHITLLASLMASSPQQMCLGKFVEGQSFDYFQNNPKIGWMIMTFHKELWRGKATYTHNTKSGKDFDFYNNVPMFRYNAYFGIHTVYYFDLLDQSGKSDLPMNKIIFSAIKTMLSKFFIHKNNKTTVMNSWTRNLFNKLDNLKFLAFVGEDGYPTIILVIQAQTADSKTLIFYFRRFF